MIHNTTVAPSRRRRQSRRQSKPEFHVGQRLLITRYPWQTSATRKVEVEDVQAIDHSAISAQLPPSYLYHLRGENGGLTLMYYGELRRRVVEVL